MSVYQEIAREVGRRTYRRAIDRMDYGNEDISAPVDEVWLEGSFGISAREQADFLRRLHGHDLAFSPRTVDAVAVIMVTESTVDHVIRSKTGWVFSTRPRRVGGGLGRNVGRDHVLRPQQPGHHPAGALRGPPEHRPGHPGGARRAIRAGMAPETATRTTRQIQHDLAAAQATLAAWNEDHRPAHLTAHDIYQARARRRPRRALGRRRATVRLRL